MKGYTHLRQDEIDRVVASYRETKSTRLTAETLGIPRHRVALAIRKAHLPLSGSTAGACYRQAAQVRQWAAEGLSLSEIARRVGTNRHSVARFLAVDETQRTPFHQTMENNPAWKGGRIVDHDGYILVKQAAHPFADRHGYVREHRLVLEQQLRRYLLPGEVVHHRDGNRANNHPDNLHLFGSNGAHLAETLQGQIPKWTAEGRARTLTAVRQPRKRKRTAIPEG